ncbi:19593_t:CDS:2, partial [Cetraspora pellucida]
EKLERQVNLWQLLISRRNCDEYTQFMYRDASYLSSLNSEGTYIYIALMVAYPLRVLDLRVHQGKPNVSQIRLQNNRGFLTSFKRYNVKMWLKVVKRGYVEMKLDDVSKKIVASTVQDVYSGNIIPDHMLTTKYNNNPFFRDALRQIIKKKLVNKGTFEQIFDNRVNKAMELLK